MKMFKNFRITARRLLGWAFLLFGACPIAAQLLPPDEAMPTSNEPCLTETLFEREQTFEAAAFGFLNGLFGYNAPGTGCTMYGPPDLPWVRDAYIPTTETPI